MILKISVVMSVYNGAKYLTEQLESIQNQSRIPDEFIILDDCSTDNGATTALVETFIKSNENWRLLKNAKNAGWQSNFMQGAKIATGDIIFFADQDDVWESDKIEKMSTAFTENICVLVSNYICINENGMKIRNSFRFNDGRIEQIKMDRYFIETKRPGCAMAITKKVIEQYSDLWIDNMPHDQFFCLIGLFCNGLYIIHSPLLRHRLHENNTTGSISFDRYKRISTQIVRTEQLYKILHCKYFNPFFEANKNILQAYFKWSERRINMLNNRSIVKWLGLFFQIKSFYVTKRTCIGDLISILRHGTTDNEKKTGV